MVNPVKVEIVERATGKFNRAQSVVVVDYKGLTVAQINDLRNQLREADGELKVIKNRLTRRALEEAGCEPLDEILSGPNAMAFGYGDPTSPAKVCSKFAEKNEALELKGGLLEKKMIGLDKVEALAKLPDREELLGKMAVAMKAPAQQMATAMNQAIAKLAYAMKARADQLGGEGEEAA